MARFTKHRQKQKGGLGAPVTAWDPLKQVDESLRNITFSRQNTMAELALKPIQLTAAALLASGETITDTASKSGVTRQAVHTWLRDNNEFLAYFNALKSENVTAARTAIQAVACQAVTTMSEIMKNGTNDAARLAAAKEILAMAGLTEATKSMAEKGIGEVTAEKVQAEKESNKKHAARMAMFD